MADEPSAYLQRLNEQAVADGLLKEDYKEKQNSKTKEIKQSTTDPESGYMHRPGKPNGFHYLSHQTCDSEHGLITDVFVTPGNTNDRSVHSERIKTQIDKYGFETEAVCADKGYDSSEIHADMYERGIQTYIPRQSVSAEESRFQVSDYEYDETSDSYHCPAGKTLPYKYFDHRNGGKVYYSRDIECRDCPHRDKCFSSKSKRKLILRKQTQTAYETQCSKNDTPEYFAAMRLRQIWCEGNFSHQKANHNLKRVRTRGLGKATMHCLLSATALNLKRMVKLLAKRSLLRKTQSARYYEKHNFLQADARKMRVCFYFLAFVNSTISSNRNFRSGYGISRNREGLYHFRTTSSGVFPNNSRQGHGDTQKRKSSANVV